MAINLSKPYEGTSVYFWAFPSKASGHRKRRLETLKEQLSTVKCRFFDIYWAFKLSWKKLDSGTCLTTRLGLSSLFLFLVISDWMG